ncbi:MAG: class I SAM-dependent methyltransferase [Thermoanaerobacteraceae bacterium]|nr:class I SAM-dependent methyltransferase [Thermoanaerobacteraceae bacterium]
MKLSKRLLAISSKVMVGEGLADIGTDHGKLPVYLILNNIIPYAIASDSRASSLKKAEELVKKYGLDGKIDLRLGEGLSILGPGETSQITIAGMGGPLIAEIIYKGFDVVKTVERLILQPMQYPDYLSRWLYENNFDIIDEDLVEDGGRIYRIFVCHTGDPESVKDDIFFEIGEKLIEKGHPLLKRYIYERINKYQYIYQNLTDRDEKARVGNKLSKLEEIINEYKGPDNL